MRYDHRVLARIDQKIQHTLDDHLRKQRYNAQSRHDLDDAQLIHHLANPRDLQHVISICIDYMKTRPKLHRLSVYEVIQPFRSRIIEKLSPQFKQDLFATAPIFDLATIQRLSRPILQNINSIRTPDEFMQCLEQALPDMMGQDAYQFALMLFYACLDRVQSAKTTVLQYQLLNYIDSKTPDEVVNLGAMLSPADIEAVIMLFTSILTPFYQLRSDIINPQQRLVRNWSSSEHARINQQFRQVSNQKLRRLYQFRDYLLSKTSQSDRDLMLSMNQAEAAPRYNLNRLSETDLIELDNQLNVMLEAVGEPLDGSPPVCPNTLQEAQRMLQQVTPVISQFNAIEALDGLCQIALQPALKNLTLQLQCLNINALIPVDPTDNFSPDEDEEALVYLMLHQHIQGKVKQLQSRLQPLLLTGSEPITPHKSPTTPRVT